jgi:hypothetical protein
MNQAVRPELSAVAEQDQSFHSLGQAETRPSVDAEPLAGQLPAADPGPPHCRNRPGICAVDTMLGPASW